ncbi:MAG: hypothetical protein WCF65_00910 [Parachlamydiaceae bacterium]
MPAARKNSVPQGGNGDVQICQNVVFKLHDVGTLRNEVACGGYMGRLVPVPEARILTNGEFNSLCTKSEHYKGKSIPEGYAAMMMGKVKGVTFGELFLVENQSLLQNFNRNAEDNLVHIGCQGFIDALCGITDRLLSVKSHQKGVPLSPCPMANLGNWMYPTDMSGNLGRMVAIDNWSYDVPRNDSSETLESHVQSFMSLMTDEGLEKMTEHLLTGLGYMLCSDKERSEKNFYGSESENPDRKKANQDFLENKITETFNIGREGLKTLSYKKIRQCVLKGLENGRSLVASKKGGNKEYFEAKIGEFTTGGNEENVRLFTMIQARRKALIKYLKSQSSV